MKETGRGMKAQRTQKKGWVLVAMVSMHTSSDPSIHTYLDFNGALLCMNCPA